MADIFISYARTERKDAERIKVRLEELGLSVFFDVDGLDGGDIFSEKLDREVKTCGAVVGLWSPASLTRPWVQIECDIGKRRGVLVPVAIRPFNEMEVPAQFWNVQFVDLTDWRDDPSDVNWLKLRRALSRTLNRPEIAPTQESAPSSSSASRPAAPRRQAGAKRKPGPGLLIAALATAISVAVGGALWINDPFHWRTAPKELTVASAPAPASDSAPDLPPPKLDPLHPEKLYDAEVLPACLSVTEGRSPFFTSSSEMSAADAIRVFGANGVIDEFVRDILPLLDVSNSDWSWRSDSEVSALFHPESARQFQKAAAIRDLLTEGAPLIIELLSLSGGAKGARLVVSGEEFELGPDSNNRRELRWAFTGPPDASLTLLTQDGGPHTWSRNGVWSLGALFAQGKMKAIAPTIFETTFSSGTAAARFRVTVLGPVDPFNRSGVWSFHCPPSL